MQGLAARIPRFGPGLARLAETDVLSTVSGGSILGAHHYLEVQRLLETKPSGGHA